MKIGDTIWRFDDCHRVYAKIVDRSGKNLWGHLIYRKHWVPKKIIGETRRSWVTLYGNVSKSGAHRGWAFTEQEIDDDCWVNDYRYRIEREVGRVLDANVLRKVAALIGWGPGCAGSIDEKRF